MKTTLFTICMAFAAFAWAEGAEHGEAGLTDHVIKTIIYQTINVVMLFAGLFYFLRQPVKKYFVDKRKSFTEAAEKAEAARQAAERERLEIEVRLSKLQSTSEESIHKARLEAAEMKKALLQEAALLSQKMSREAELTARLEAERARNALRNQLIREAAEQAGSALSKLSAEDQSRMQGDFITNLQSVQS